jgi:Pilus formation protein N terminal region
VMLHGVVANVFVADPAVADVNMIDNHSVIVLGKGYGVTSILVTDQAGHTLYDGVVAVLGSEAGRVTVYRGGAAQDYHCSSRCETMNSVAAGAPVAVGAGPAASGGGSGGGENAPLNVGPPVTVTQAGGLSHP